MKKKIIAALLAVVMLTLPFVIPSVSADETTDKYNSKIDSLKEKEAEYQKELDEAKSDIADKEKYSDSLVSQIGVLSEEIEEYNNQISELNDDIYEKQLVINKAKKKITRQMEKLKERLYSIYVSGDVSSLEIILGAKDFSDFLDKVELIKTLSAYDKDLIDGIQKKLDAVKDEKAELQKSKTKVEGYRSELTGKQDKLNTLLEENEEVLASLYDDRDNAEQLIKNAKSQEAEIISKIEAYNARKAAEQEKNNNNNNNNNNSGNNGGGNDTPTPTGSYTWPVPGYYYVISPFDEDRGYSHKGIDITGGGIMGATVVAADGGTVIDSNNTCTHNWGKNGSCGCGGGYGNYVIIDHGNGKTTIYGHLSSASVSSGQTVSRGETIGYVGSTGWSTGAHLHFETRSGGVAYNPMSEF